jgi:hypothetical protein
VSAGAAARIEKALLELRSARDAERARGDQTQAQLAGARHELEASVEGLAGALQAQAAEQAEALNAVAAVQEEQRRLIKGATEAAEVQALEQVQAMQAFAEGLAEAAGAEERARAAERRAREAGLDGVRGELQELALRQRQLGGKHESAEEARRAEAETWRGRWGTAEAAHATGVRAVEEMRVQVGDSLTALQHATAGGGGDAGAGTYLPAYCSHVVILPLLFSCYSPTVPAPSLATWHAAAGAGGAVTRPPRLPSTH